VSTRLCLTFLWRGKMITDTASFSSEVVTFSVAGILTFMAGATVKMCNTTRCGSIKTARSRLLALPLVGNLPFPYTLDLLARICSPPGVSRSRSPQSPALATIPASPTTPPNGTQFWSLLGWARVYSPDIPGPQPARNTVITCWDVLSQQGNGTQPNAALLTVSLQC